MDIPEALIKLKEYLDEAQSLWTSPSTSDDALRQCKDKIEITVKAAFGEDSEEYQRLVPENRDGETELEKLLKEASGFNLDEFKKYKQTTEYILQKYEIIGIDSKKTDKTGILKELEDYYAELNNYASLVRAKIKQNLKQDVHKAHFKALIGDRERLVRRTGALQNIVVEITGITSFSVYGQDVNIWDSAFNDIDMNAQRVSLHYCADVVNKAIGKLGNDIKKGIRDKDTGEIIITTSKENPLELDTPQLYDALQLHPKINKASEKLFKDGSYKSAIHEACIALNNFVREKAKLPNDSKLSDRNVMEQAFSLDNPVIKLNALKTKNDKDEQEGFRFIYMGTTIGIRNPKSHSTTPLNDPYRALEYLSLLSLLMKRVEEGTRTRKKRVNVQT
jgi:uncharacterized protein (TIGR02391 family)